MSPWSRHDGFDVGGERTGPLVELVQGVGVGRRLVAIAIHLVSHHIQRRATCDIWMMQEKTTHIMEDKHRRCVESNFGRWEERGMRFILILVTTARSRSVVRVSFPPPPPPPPRACWRMMGSSLPSALAMLSSPPGCLRCKDPCAVGMPSCCGGE